MDYADALNAMQAHSQQLRDYGGLLAQAGLPLPDDAPAEVELGFDQQRADYPNG
jgi:hypothetical protein